ncbi:MAG: hypothetical protein AUH85_11715 [Chloroflexi bacterium 13_1_40CM_4_68_4]|nr:MAG: hypothetical protein AUH85_11715 [Chloroflexi bacterium 13_1_40CM_4_68_4]
MAVLPANLALLVVARSLVEAVPLAIAASLLARAFGRVPAPLETWVDTSAAVAFWASIGPLLASVAASSIPPGSPRRSGARSTGRSSCGAASASPGAPRPGARAPSPVSPRR